MQIKHTHTHAHTLKMENHNTSACKKNGICNVLLVSEETASYFQMLLHSFRPL